MPLSKLKRTIVQEFLKEKQIESDKWHCCDTAFTSITDIGYHVNQSHRSEIDAREIQRIEEKQEKQRNLCLLKQRRGKKGSSDPIATECQCQPENSKVILFYKYTLVKDPVKFALDHQHYCANMTGKIRIASEGINATLAGSNQDIDRYLDWLTLSQPFNNAEDSLKHSESLRLDNTSTVRYKFFKPSQGCSHVFSELSIKLVDEICPLGQTTVVLEKLQKPDHDHGKLSPSDFHNILAKRHQDDYILLDTRNYYESKIGHFEGAIQPPIRKFSQFPSYVERNKDSLRGKTILTYCTGGIRCEKATAFMRQALPDEDIFMLDGGIHNYLEWWKSKGDEKGQEDNPIWQGKNYVFDARQALALDDKSVVSQCQRCNQLWDKYKKCASTGCHLLILYCDACCASNQPVFCCTDCQSGQQNGLCACEKERRSRELEQLQVS
ncbi:Rhodanese-like domain-containing protein [Parasitella parasitica]|nr:Rhodanese-like domain-containing protein [Parasitella parasitica]